jgi:DNA damage-inducible protein 1
LNEQQRLRREQENAEFRRVNQMNADPFSAEAQAAIAEEIRVKNVQENMETAMEHNPEAFGRVCMLYVPMVCNGVPSSSFLILSCRREPHTSDDLYRSL